MPTWRDLWHQRQRWQRGALENIGMYGMSSATARYWTQQFALGYGVLALGSYLALTVLSYLAFGVFTVVIFWVLIGALFAVERTVTVWPGGWRARLLAAPLLIELVYAIVLAARLHQVTHRHHPRPLQTLEPRHRQGSIPMSFLATSSLASNRWFVLLVVFVGFNTVVYAALAFGKLWPRRRR